MSPRTWEIRIMRTRSLASILGIATLAFLGTCGCGSRQPSQPSASAPSTAPATAPGSAPVEAPVPQAGESGAETAQGAPHPVPLVPAHGQGGHELTWQAPEGWEVETPSSAMRRAQYRLPAVKGDTEAGECAVFFFGSGQGGDVGANVQRWAGQFKGSGGAPPTPKVTEIKAGGLTVTRVEAKGTYEASGGMGAPHGGGGEKQGYMLLGAIVAGPDANWFFKCTGPEKTMEANRQRFDRMIASAR